jgi:hypothetical protein
MSPPEIPVSRYSQFSCFKTQRVLPLKSQSLLGGEEDFPNRFPMGTPSRSSTSFVKSLENLKTH